MMIEKSKDFLIDLEQRQTNSDKQQQTATHKEEIDQY
jgi:hypothetical protein